MVIAGAMLGTRLQTLQKTDMLISGSSFDWPFSSVGYNEAEITSFKVLAPLRETLNDMRQWGERAFQEVGATQTKHSLCNPSPILWLSTWSELRTRKKKPSPSPKKLLGSYF